jgi:hypothetical protein
MFQESLPHAAERAGKGLLGSSYTGKSPELALGSA